MPHPLSRRIILGALFALAAMPAAEADVRDPLTPENSLLLLIDFQPQYVFSVQSVDVTVLTNNVAGIAKAAKLFEIPTFAATINAKSFAGPVFPQLQAARPDITPFDRTVINAWDEQRLREAIAKTGRKKLLIGGLWTDSCVTLPALSALKDGYEVYVLTDVAGDVNKQSHDMAIQRMVQAGAVPVSWLAVMLEWQRDWANQKTAAGVAEIAQQHGGAWGLGVFYAQQMKVGGQ
jgi:nicotinamidase-related amidase